MTSVITVNGRQYVKAEHVVHFGGETYVPQAEAPKALVIIADCQGNDWVQAEAGVDLYLLESLEPLGFPRTGSHGYISDNYGILSVRV